MTAANSDQDTNSDSETAKRRSEKFRVHHSERSSVRREQIVLAAKEIIAKEGIHRFSLSRLEKQVEMARGHLTYYFPTKEEILLAVFDKMLTDLREQMIEEAVRNGAPRPMTGQMLQALPVMLSFHRSNHPEHRDFLSLVWTFLAQMNHRPDFRQRIADANSNWRGMVGADYQSSVMTEVQAKPNAVASVMMALISGLDAQLAVDPNAFDKAEVTELCLQLLTPLFSNPPKDHEHKNSD
jgi:AcrR family transcriptional regulator